MVLSQKSWQNPVDQRFVSFVRKMQKNEALFHGFFPRPT